MRHITDYLIKRGLKLQHDRELYDAIKSLNGDETYERLYAVVGRSRRMIVYCMGIDNMLTRKSLLN